MENTWRSVKHTRMFFFCYRPKTHQCVLPKTHQCVLRWMFYLNAETPRDVFFLLQSCVLKVSHMKHLVFTVYYRPYSIAKQGDNALGSICPCVFPLNPLPFLCEHIKEQTDGRTDAACTSWPVPSASSSRYWSIIIAKCLEETIPAVFLIWCDGRIVW